MKRAFEKLVAAYGYYTGRYKCRRATEADMVTYYDLRKKVFGAELKRHSERTISPAEKDNFDDVSCHIVCVDTTTDEIVGGLRITKGHFFRTDQRYWEEYALKHFSEDLLPRIMVVSRLTVLKEHRKSAASVELASKCYELGMLSFDGIFSILVCEPNLYPLYRRLGYRPLDKISLSPFGGYRLPLVLVGHDYLNLKKQYSPFFKIAKRIGFPENEIGKEWIKEQTASRGLIHPGFSLVAKGEQRGVYSKIFDGLSEDGQQELMNYSIVIECQKGDHVLADKSGGKNMGFVLKGALEVQKNDQTVAILGEGDIFGEIAFIINTPRSADLVAATPDTEIILLSNSSIEKLSSKDDQIQIWKNLSTVVAERFFYSMRRDDENSEVEEFDYEDDARPSLTVPSA